jgi:hypothetical protein
MHLLHGGGGWEAEHAALTTLSEGLTWLTAPRAHAALMVRAISLSLSLSRSLSLSLGSGARRADDAQLGAHAHTPLSWYAPQRTGHVHVLSAKDPL